MKYHWPLSCSFVTMLLLHKIRKKGSQYVDVDMKGFVFALAKYLSCKCNADNTFL